MRGRGARAGTRGGVGHWRHAHDSRLLGQGRRGAHPEHFVHVRNAGRVEAMVEAQRLVERRRPLPSQTEGIRCGAEFRVYSMRGGVRGGEGGPSSLHGWARLQIGGKARGGAHVEHGAHSCDAGGVEAQRLVERMCVLPSRTDGIRCGMWAGK